ncbi:putative toxin-antitoxin system toxin component, PIN family [Denitromonas iodatirespirans]|uniref:Toxin-antitoxin system toxin component, PIN family n=1 Tax=Denitromonas iodatirespirans TaxID=2795389 RepID=A0A944DF58_DENI1|nr:putative toxin-antitoxin system toxin component, PIN family [Denitromonas iodatirespirans]MBT0963268.1 putative toxin-antitoxin system toxin component, PIN family [Denitromonas iodatirespirans]
MTPTVLDTNTIMALWFFDDPALGILRAWIAAGHARLLTREDALEELRRVLAYRQFACPPDRQAGIFDTYRAQATCVPPAAPAADLPRCRDADDQKFLEIAHDGQARWLLTRDKALLRAGRHRLMRERCAVITPEAWQKAFPASD